MTRCKRCGTGLNPICFITPCPACGMTTDGFVNQASSKLSQPIPLIPMEDPAYANAPLIALIDTILECITKPAHFFSKMCNSNNQLAPVIFSLVLGSVSILATYVWKWLLPSLSDFGNTAFLESMVHQTSTNTLFFAPFLLLLKIFAVSAYIHVILTLFRKKRSPFLATFRMVCYTESSALLTVIPWIGGYFSLLLWIFLTLTGIHTIHHIGKAKSLFILSIIPVSLFFFLFIIIILIMVGIGISAGSNLRGLLSFFSS